MLLYITPLAITTLYLLHWPTKLCVLLHLANRPHKIFYNLIYVKRMQGNLYMLPLAPRTLKTRQGVKSADDHKDIRFLTST